ncbi:tetratricopeptide repeat-containing sulfotransferase family protein [Tundrisphaera lichenicola]|uniref:tetratricopeptide repeat-containing sulfotransferase family protein n=1 Tax=Tundrisphaera lichenicola TaxID=2029860 RepID=UPI003EBF011F
MLMDLSLAMEEHRRGNLARAAAAYEGALVEDPDRPDALYLLGLTALQLGDPKRALVLFGRAVTVRPDEADYQGALAEACRMLGQIDRAVDCCREAARLRPDSPEALCNLGAILVDQGKVDEALGHFREALRLRPDLVAVHNNLGHAYRLQGDIASALAHFRAAVQIDPTTAEARGNLGKILLERGVLEEALVHSREAVRLGPGLVAAWLQLGHVFLRLGRPREAEACYREAIRLRPDYAPAHASLGGVLEQLGDSEPAIASLREALRHDPRHAGALARLAIRLRERLPREERAAIEGLLADPSLSPDRREPLLFGLGQVLDAHGEFDRAALLIGEANALQRAEFRRQGQGYDPGAYRAFVDQLLGAFTPDFFARVRGWGPETDRPVFVVGLPRSGTTLVEQILASHPRAFGAGELPMIPQLFTRLPEVVEGPATVRARLDRLGRDSVQGMARGFLDGLAALDGSAARVIDKMPENYLYLGLIAALFPSARVIHCRRDPRDVALSCWMNSFGQVRWASDPDHIASRIEDYRRVMDHWRRALPTPLFEVDYEELVAEPGRISRDLVAWIGLEWDPACLDFHQARHAVQSASVAQVRRPIYRTSVGRWENYREALGPWFARIGPGR